MKKVTFFIMCYLNFFLVSCTSHVSSIKKDVDIPLAQKEGYLMLGVDTNYDLQWVKLWGKKNVLLTKDDLKSGSNFILVNIPEGSYRIESIKLGQYIFNDFRKELWSFKVKENVISYVGHLNMESRETFSGVTSNILLLNKSSFALEYLERRFPNILTSRQLQYWGQGDDGFFKEVIAVKEAKK